MTRALIDEEFDYYFDYDNQDTNWQDPKLTSPTGFKQDGQDLNVIPIPDGIESIFSNRFTVKIDFAEILYWVHKMILMTRGDGLYQPTDIPGWSI